MSLLSRRKVLAFGAAGGVAAAATAAHAASFGNPERASARGGERQIRTSANPGPQIPLSPASSRKPRTRRRRDVGDLPSLVPSTPPTSGSRTAAGRARSRRPTSRSPRRNPA